MILVPLHDTFEGRHEPHATQALVAMNLLVFIALGLARVNPVTVFKSFGFVPASPSLVAAFSCMFLHANVVHLVGNLLFLWTLGRSLEAKLGVARYLLLYLATGLGATLVFALFHGADARPLAGASGAISGLLGAYAWLLPGHRIKLWWFVWFFGRTRHGTYWVNAAFAAGAWLIMQLLDMLLAGSGPVAYLAHVSGVLLGFGAAVAAVRLGWVEQDRRDVALEDLAVARYQALSAQVARPATLAEGAARVMVMDDEALSEGRPADEAPQQRETEPEEARPSVQAGASELAVFLDDEARSEERSAVEAPQPLEAEERGDAEPESASPEAIVLQDGFVYVLEPVRAIYLRDAASLIADLDPAQGSPDEVLARFEATRGLLATGLQPEQVDTLRSELSLLGLLAHTSHESHVLPLPPFWPVSEAWGAADTYRLVTPLGHHERPWAGLRFALFAHLAEGSFIDLVTDRYERFRLDAALTGAENARPTDVGEEQALTTTRFASLLLTNDPDLLHNDDLATLSVGRLPERAPFEREADWLVHARLFSAHAQTRLEAERAEC
jgi:membrane associated rhomboid family serine protease